MSPGPISGVPGPVPPVAEPGLRVVPRGSGGDAITDAAREIFDERGYHGASIRDIARRAGLSLSALYYWYPSKQSLLVAIIEKSGLEYARICDSHLSEAGTDPTRRLCALVAATVRYRVRHRVESAINASEWRNLEPDNRVRLEERQHAATAVWSDVIDGGVRSGAFRCAHPEDARRSIQAACNAVAQWYVPEFSAPGRGTVEVDELVQRYTAIALRIVDHPG
ncbi:TetR/AcrR family transcriptional regulator [Pseudonocardia sp. GCM10023141]|uniref:TetR/AcrR family transcriptional regulator n=1 Tax=Pseudonocardia sp. GCM10023141 TaxID=3252653 RepID=UPI003608183E